jgi:hypothetical protein
MATNPVFAAAFKSGEQLTDHDLGRFHRFLEPNKGEPPAAYVNRLAVNGLAFYMSSEETRNIPEYKAQMEAARAANVPLVVMTGVIGAPTGDDPRTAEDQAKADALAAARASTR